ncbi:pentapeptide repeat-containing protein [Dehalobacter sp. TeCB1]|uniref:pentapeptide repeat-containing protein n=1 Tax=Dehalobacter sp. TeCB1 TaxID=1843715 RepID=UPI0009F73A1A|nr:pentapeptide repeat-containing protein [Dehalobacter sp. TeCB1]
MNIGDFVKGLPGNGYSITDENMTKGVVVDVLSESEIRVKILEHVQGGSGTWNVKASAFEVIGHQKEFNREEVLELLRSGCKKAILDYDLRSADLRSADLRSADLRSADLRSANLRSADLRSANLRSADLRSADLSGADLSGADLSGANLSGADLRSANLRSADLRSADLSGADLSGADLSGADLRSADLSGADLDFSCLPLRCGGLRWKIDKRLACQLAFHLCSMQCDDEEYIKMRNSILDFANQFHRVDECGRLEPVEPTETAEAVDE